MKTLYLPLLFVPLVMGCSKSAKLESFQQDARPNVAKPSKEGAAQAEKVPRKIIYSGNVELVVDEFQNAEQQLVQLVEANHGYIAKSELTGSPGSPRSGTWTVRVPVDQFKGMMEALARLGELRRSRTDSDDITDRYYDLKAHLKNNQVQEEGLQKLYLEKSTTAKLEDLLAIKRELRAIRGEIDQQEGQLQRWDKETEYSTVTVTLHDRKDYVPPTSPAFGTNIGRTFLASIDLMVEAGKGIVLVAVAMGPWLLVLALVAAPAWILFRRRRTRRAGGWLTASPVESPAPQTPA
jgi:hypothetical protein